MAPNFLALATTLENLGARWLLAKKVNFVPCTKKEDTDESTEKKQSRFLSLRFKKEQIRTISCLGNTAFYGHCSMKPCMLVLWKDEFPVWLSSKLHSR